ncbi:NADH-quinone oxidoreductase subunit N [Alsobacter metallidurans]|uniref:NADH-quinone oxidoreductase subunit N n=1 Tax=Alsobacter metallidurans TaxID=340221 RepID=A0A917MI29_9HYPH|nr:NADH-quinone oxidoreductase subunit NuoN [Alsobacter metallidurans]GGH20559.1 NADH-quinone oxidoreductase subunit N [Alsobacter metallidurans]
MPGLTAAVPALGLALPEIILAIGALALVLLGAIRGDRSVGLINGLALALLVVVGVLVMTRTGRAVTFNGSFVQDDFAKFMKIAAIIGSAVALVMSIDYWRDERVQRFEYPILIVLSTIGMMMMISAGDLIALYLGLELMSLALYVVAAFHRDNVRATEAGLKYFVLGALSSGMLLYGASLVYGFTGSVSFGGIAAALKDNGSTGVVFGLVFVMAGLCFKISAVPFHMWTPDVYEGAPTPVTAFFAAAPKMAAMALAVRVVITAFPGILSQWQQIIVFVAIASMALGAFAAIGQRNIKRLMAYSSIGHMGFALVGLAAGTTDGVQGVAIYMAIYLVMTLGTFAVILSMRRADGYVETIEDLAGLGRTAPGTAFVFAMLMFSLAGIPPLAGFFAKWYVFAAAVNAHLYTLAVIGVLTSVVSTYYYLRIVKIMYFDEPAVAFEPMAPTLKIVSGLSGAFILLFWLWPAPLVSAATAAAKSLF